MKIYEKLIGTSPRGATAAGLLPYRSSCRRRFAVIFTGCFLTMIVSVIHSTKCYARDDLLFRDTNFGKEYGRLKKAPLSMPDGPRETTTLSCERLHFAADRGVCLTAHRGVFTTYDATIFGPNFQPIFRLPLKGPPTHVRVAPDGRVAAITILVRDTTSDEDEIEAEELSFSTLTTIVDLHQGNVLVEDMAAEFTVRFKGQRFQAANMNFSSVTFTRDGNQFYATLQTNTQTSLTDERTFLVKGHLAFREAEILRDDIVNPSLSPDNTKIAFTKRVDLASGRRIMRLSVLDLQTLSEQSLAETRNVDEQVEWLDNSQVLYSLPDEATAARRNTWVVQAKGRGNPNPRRFAKDASSPAAVRNGSGL